MNRTAKKLIGFIIACIIGAVFLLFSLEAMGVLHYVKGALISGPGDEITLADLTGEENPSDQPPGEEEVWRRDKIDRALAKFKLLLSEKALLTQEVELLRAQVKEGKAGLPGKDLIAVTAEREELRGKLEKLTASLDEKKEALKTITQEREALKNELTKRGAEYADLSKGMSLMRMDLTMCEQEVKTLSTGSASRAVPAAAKSKPTPQAPAPQTGRRELGAPSSTADTRVPPPSSDVETVEVHTKAHLRTGPGLEHSPVMQVDTGSKLVVEAREGEWIRVISPNGTRAYINQELVTVSAGSRSSNRAPARIQLPQESSGNQPSSQPRKPPLRVVAPTEDMVPFGDATAPR